MKHYFNPFSRGAITHWMLKELNVAHESVHIDFAAGENDSPDFRALNPMGKIPVLVDEGIVVTEVAAICAYLADKFPHKKLAPPPDSLDRGAYYRYLFMAGNTLEPAMTLNASGMTHPEPKTAGWGDMERVQLTIEQMTPDSDWALGARFTAADVVFGGLLDSALRFKLISDSGRVSRYVERIRIRPAYLAAHDVSLKTPDAL
ncbi:glutathione S-transferase [Arenicella chitinivorans]|uniref:Glutathione S-transferase n=1 Tax=Arenicella chitinivorans TaxID=1329800 RepID=A0A918VN27_9GAMM|nr:glutathione S-transferase family protein [Arenicella chitinivorans]GHA10570.1 glutathione S-transferase [Arenicella chitinivorans]